MRTSSSKPWIWSFQVAVCRGRQRNAPTFETQLQGNCFSSLNLLFIVVCVVAVMGTLRNHDDNANENVTWKVRVTCTTLHAYSNSYNFYNVAELSSNRTGGNGLQVSTENENLLSCAHALHKTLNLGISRCCLAGRNVSIFYARIY